MPSKYDNTTTGEAIAHDLARDIANKTVLITGVSPGGLGAQLALTIAPHRPKLLILAARDVSKAQKTADDIEARASGVGTKVLELDLGDFESVRKAAETVKGWGVKVDVLVNNAGIMGGELGRVGGVERQFAVNHAGPFLFTCLVLRDSMDFGGSVYTSGDSAVNAGGSGSKAGDDEGSQSASKADGKTAQEHEKVEDAETEENGDEKDRAEDEQEEEEPQVKGAPKEERASPRVICVASDGYRLSPVRWDWNFKDDEAYDKWVAYGQSKTANMLFAVSLAEKLGKKGLLAFSIHPGVISTNLSRSSNDEDFAELQALDRRLGNPHGWRDITTTFRSLSQGVATHIFAAFDPSLTSEVNGAYCEDSAVMEKKDVSAYARDPFEAERLWGISEGVVGEEFRW